MMVERSIRRPARPELLEASDETIDDAVAYADPMALRGLLYQLTTALSKLNLNIASAHVATFGERARDVFYVTDLLGAQINAPTRQAAIKSALLHLLSSDDAVAKPAA